MRAPVTIPKIMWFWSPPVHHYSEVRTLNHLKGEVHLLTDENKSVLNVDLFYNMFQMVEC